MEVGIVIFPLPALVCADTMNVHPFPPEKIPIFIRCKKLYTKRLKKRDQIPETAKSDQRASLQRRCMQRLIRSPAAGSGQRLPFQKAGKLSTSPPTTPW